MIQLLWRVLAKRPQLTRAMELLTPAWTALASALPELRALYQDVAPSLFPDMTSSIDVILEFRTVQLQRMLAALGYDVGLTDGVYGDRTQEAVQQLQHAHDLPPTGWLDWTTLVVAIEELRQKGLAVEEIVLDTGKR